MVLGALGVPRHGASRQSLFFERNREQDLREVALDNGALEGEATFPLT